VLVGIAIAEGGGLTGEIVKSHDSWPHETARAGPLVGKKPGCLLGEYSRALGQGGSDYTVYSKQGSHPVAHPFHSWRHDERSPRAPILISERELK
jgi:hypothetical protein